MDWQTLTPLAVGLVIGVFIGIVSMSLMIVGSDNHTPRSKMR